MTTRLYYAPKTRAFTALWLLEELGIPYELESFRLDTQRHKQPDYLAFAPMGKVPAVVDHGVGLAETGAIAMFLADKYPQAGLSPRFDSEERAAYLQWIVFAGSVIEPAFGEKFFQWKVPKSSVAWGSFDDMIQAVTAGLGGRAWLVGDGFSAADIVVGATLAFGVKFGIISPDSVIGQYVQRLAARPAFQRAEAIEQAEIERLDLGA